MIHITYTVENDFVGDRDSMNRCCFIQIPYRIASTVHTFAFDLKPGVLGRRKFIAMSSTLSRKGHNKYSLRSESENDLTEVTHPFRRSQ